MIFYKDIETKMRNLTKIAINQIGTNPNWKIPDPNTNYFKIEILQKYCSMIFECLIYLTLGRR